MADAKSKQVRLASHDNARMEKWANAGDAISSFISDNSFGVSFEGLSFGHDGASLSWQATASFRQR